jgi:hypothetical protein
LRSERPCGSQPPAMSLRFHTSHGPCVPSCRIHRTVKPVRSAARRSEAGEKW